MPACSHNEWDPLREVVVGSVDGAQEMAFEPAIGPYFEPEPEARSFTGGRHSQREVREAQEQLDDFATTLERFHVKVHRPLPYPVDASAKSPDFQVEFGNCYACPRDVLLLVGDRLIEAPMAWRSRFFEYRGYRHITQRHFAEGGTWLAVPKPEMADADYAPNYTTSVIPYEPESHPVILSSSPYFDAACFARCGRDIFWQPDIVSNEAGAAWLRRTLGPEYRVHRVEFHDRYPQHIDTTLVPLRPGLALVNPERPPKAQCLDLFSRSGWQLVPAPPSVRAGLPAPARDVSNWISMNLLMLDPTTAVIEQGELPLAQLLQSLGIRTIGVPFDRVYKFGGGIHCCTLDLRRDGSLESYFSL